ncbi:unnamed protein product, partial [Linum tenue]
MGISYLIHTCSFLHSGFNPSLRIFLCHQSTAGHKPHVVFAFIGCEGAKGIDLAETSVAKMMPRMQRKKVDEKNMCI